MIWDWEHSQSKSHWGELHGSPGQWCTNQHHYARVCWKSFSGCQPLSYLIGGCVICAGLGNTLTWPIGYIIICVQVGGFLGYDKDQIAHVVLDLSNSMAWVPVILGTPTIACIVNVIKEKEIDTLAMPCINAHVAYSTEYDEVVTTKGSKTIDAFSSRSYTHRWRLHSLVWGWMWWLMHYVLKRGHCSKIWWYRMPTPRCTMAARVLLS